MYSSVSLVSAPCIACSYKFSMLWVRWKDLTQFFVFQSSIQHSAEPAVGLSFFFVTVHPLLMVIDKGQNASSSQIIYHDYPVSLFSNTLLFNRNGNARVLYLVYHEVEIK